MTRETKIGLLVGLAFIIVIGILLSDHLTSANDPPPAAMGGTGNSVREQVATPGSATQAPLVTEVTPPEVQPLAPVPTNRDLERPAQAQAREIVQVGGPIAQESQSQQPAGPPITIIRDDPSAQIAAAQEPAQQAQSQNQQPGRAEVAGADPPHSAFATQHPIERIAAQHNETLVAINSAGQQPSPQQQPPQQQQRDVIANAAGMREYTAQPGDNLSRMANRLMGANTKANRDAIVRANPSLQENPDMVVVGKTYRIPSTGSDVARVAPVAPVNPVADSATRTPMPEPRRQAASATEYWYTVKEGDSLWKIADEQLGNGGAWASIKELNKDVLNGGEVVTPNMRLRLPSKPLARAN
jgi:nucleoid-associated protein YgaU